MHSKEQHRGFPSVDRYHNIDLTTGYCQSLLSGSCAVNSRPTEPKTLSDLCISVYTFYTFVMRLDAPSCQGTFVPRLCRTENRIHQGVNWFSTNDLRPTHIKVCTTHFTEHLRAVITEWCFRLVMSGLVDYRKS